MKKFTVWYSWDWKSNESSSYFNLFVIVIINSSTPVTSIKEYSPLSIVLFGSLHVTFFSSIKQFKKSTMSPFLFLRVDFEILPVGIRFKLKENSVNGSAEQNELIEVTLIWIGGMKLIFTPES